MGLPGKEAARRRRAWGAALLGAALAGGCSGTGTISTPGPPPARATWLGVTQSVAEGPVDLVLRLERSGTRATGSFTLQAAVRSGTLQGTIAEGEVRLELVQQAPCAARLALDGTLLDGEAEMGGTWTGTACDGRPVQGAFAAVLSGQRPAPAAFVGGAWEAEVRYGTVREDLVLRLDQPASVVSGDVATPAGVLVGRAAGVLTGMRLQLVIERFAPCPARRLVVADVAPDLESMAGSWSGSDCGGIQVARGTFAAERP